MEQIHEFTRPQLVKIMQDWVAAYMRDPAKFGELDEDGIGEAQADYVIEQLKTN